MEARRLAYLEAMGIDAVVVRHQTPGTPHLLAQHLSVGVINAGSATNVVADSAALKAEARGHDPAFRNRIVKAIETAFAEAAKRIRSADGKTGKVIIEGRLDYEAFRLDDDEPCVVAACEAVRAIGLTPRLEVSNGGLDANWMAANGIPTVTLGCGQMEIHTTNERLDLDAFEAACTVALRLAVLLSP